MPSTAMYFLLGLLVLGGLALTIGLADARKKKRNAFGWLVSLVTSLIGGACGFLAAGAAIDAIGKLLPLNWTTERYGLDVAAGVGGAFGGLLLGAWLALRLVNGWRD